MVLTEKNKHHAVISTTIMYGIPLKWEPHGEVTTWGEATLILLHRKNIYLHDFALHKKGVVYELHAWKQGVLDGQWEQWVDAHSPIARTVLKSLLPSILSKSLLYGAYPATAGGGGGRAVPCHGAAT